MKLNANSNGRSEPENIQAVILTGPTASGKTALSLSLAEALGGEILSCDSMQVYRHMDIGTAKATPEEQKRVPHHLIDLIEPWEDFSVADYCAVAKKTVFDLAASAKTPVFVGGTGLYVTSLAEGYSYDDAWQTDDALHRELERLAAAEGGVSRLYAYLRENDPAAAEKIHINNTKRLIRAVELHKLTGKTQEVRNQESRQDGPFVNARVFALCPERESLYARIDARVDEMIRMGLVEEVASVRELCERAGRKMSKTALQAIGYKETIAYIEGKIKKDEMVEAIKSATRKYAKRQLTWLRKWPWVQWIKPEETGDLLACVLSHLSEHTDHFPEHD